MATNHNGGKSDSKWVIAQSIQVSSPMVKVMQSSAELSFLTPQWEDLSHTSVEPAQLDNIKAQLDLVLLALEALAGIGSDAMLQAATQLNLESKVPDQVALWRLRQSNPLRESEGGRKKLDVEEARALVLIICYLAKQHQELIRRAIALLEQVAADRAQQAPLLGDYLDAFSNTYQERMEDDKTSTDILSKLALKLLIDLLFYSGPSGHRRLWLALIDRSAKELS